MAKSFQDQLLKSGLVNKQQLNESKSNKHKSKKLKKKSASTQQDNKSLNEQQRKQAQDKQLNQQLQAKRLKKALGGEIKQLIDANKINCEDGDIVYKFVDQGTIKQIYVSRQVQKDLAAEKLQVVRYENSYVVIGIATVATILQRDPNYTVIKNESHESDDDSYAGYDVPDDLIW